MPNMLEAALKYADMGFSIIPVNTDKKSFVPWTEFQTRKSTPEEIKQWFTKWPKAMIGLVTGQISNLCVIDADSQEAIEQIETFLPENIVIPIASTPRGGRHYYFKHQDGLVNRANVLEKIDIRTKGGYIIAPPSQNNGSGQYRWEIEIEAFNLLEMPSSLYNKIYTSSCVYRGLPIEDTNDHTNHKQPQILTQGRRDEDLFHIANCLIKGGCEIGVASEVLNILGNNCEPKFPESEVMVKIQSVLKRTSRVSRNISAEVREWVLATNGYITTTDCHKDLNLTTNDHKKAANMTLLRLKADGVVEKHGEKNGCYRLIEKNEDDEMEFIENDVPEYPVKMPFGLNDICSLYAQNIVIIAGSKSSGKTAFLLNLALLNQDRHEVVYLNSEMGAAEWTVRMKKFGCMTKDDIKFKAKSCHKNFHDKIGEGRKIYIIDYMEINDDFWKVSARIREIHEKLKDGICFIAIQKKRGEPFARGGEFTGEKSRLYLSMEFEEKQACTKMTIVDAKANKLPGDVRGMHKRIKIIGGYKMEQLDREWQRN